MEYDEKALDVIRNLTQGVSYGGKTYSPDQILEEITGKSPVGQMFYSSAETCLRHQRALDPERVRQLPEECDTPCEITGLLRKMAFNPSGQFVEIIRISDEVDGVSES